MESMIVTISLWESLKWCEVQNASDICKEWLAHVAHLLSNQGRGSVDPGHRFLWVFVGLRWPASTSPCSACCRYSGWVLAVFLWHIVLQQFQQYNDHYHCIQLIQLYQVIPWFNLWAMLIILSPRFPWHGVSLIREDITMKAIDRERERRSNNIITVSVGIRVVRHVRLRMRRYKHFVVAWAWTSYAGRCGPKAPQALASPQTVCSDAAQGMEAEIRVDCSDWNLCWRCWRLDSIT